MSQVIESPRQADLEMQLLRARELMEVATLDYKRMLKAVHRQLTQTQMATVLRLSQPAVAKALQRAESVPDTVGEFKAASPHEVCQRYAAGLIDREEVIRELVAWPYRSAPEINEFGELESSTAGTFTDVENAVSFGLIDDAIYEEVFNQLTA